MSRPSSPSTSGCRNVSAIRCAGPSAGAPPRVEAPSASSRSRASRPNGLARLADVAGDCTLTQPPEALLVWRRVVGLAVVDAVDVSDAIVVVLQDEVDVDELLHHV